MRLMHIRNRIINLELVTDIQIDEKGGWRVRFAAPQGDGLATIYLEADEASALRLTLTQDIEKVI